MTASASGFVPGALAMSRSALLRMSLPPIS